MEVLKAGEHEKCQPCTLNEAACSSRFHCRLLGWGLCRLLGRINHAPTRKFCESVYKNISVKITRSKKQVYLWCHSTWGILTSCEEVAAAVSLHLVLHMEQSWGAPPQPLMSPADFASPVRLRVNH